MLAQQPQGTPPATDAPPADVPRARDSGNLPPGRAFNPTNLPPGRPFQALLNTNANVVVPPGTNQLLPTGQAAPQTNRPQTVGVTNTVTATNTIDFSITNTLATLPPAQVQNVIQVQNSLSALQNIAISMGPAQNIQIMQNPQVQQQVQTIAGQIAALAQGPKPSHDLLHRLSFDLLRAYSRARTTPDIQLVIAVVINQACNSSTMAPQQVEQTINNALSALQSAGVPLSTAHPVSCDLHSIAYELQPALAR